MNDTLTLPPVLAQAENEQPPPKNGAAAELAKRRAAKLTPERRSEIAHKAAKARWRKEKRKKH